MATALGAHPLITLIILFVVFFAIFFLLIYGALRYAENRKPKKDSAPSDEVEYPRQIPTYNRSKTCSRCGTTMPGIASYCPECGAPQIAA